MNKTLISKISQSTKKAAAAIIIALCFFATPILQMSSNAATYSATATDGVKVRTAPATTATVMGKVNKGDKIEVVRTVKKGETYNKTKADMNFYQLKTGGFVAAGYIKLGNVVGTSSQATPKPEVEVEEISPDENIEIIDSEQSEELIQDENAELIEEGPDESGTTEVVAEGEETKTGKAKKVAAKASVHIRETPSKDAKSVGVVNSKKTITVVGTILTGETFDEVAVTEDWYILNAGGGYVMSQYFDDVAATKETIKKVTTTSRVAISKAGATMYSKPIDLSTQKGTLAKGKSMAISSTISNGSSVQGTKAIGTWYKLSNGAFVKSSSVSVETKTNTVDQKSVSNAVTIDLKDGITSTQSVRIRSKPSTKTGAIMGLFAPGDFEIVEQIIAPNSVYEGITVSGKWYKISTGGFVSADYVKFSPEATIAKN